MRTTVTLDDDTVAILNKAMRERDLSFKQAVNELIRAGASPRKPRKVKFPVYDLGEPLEDLTKANQIAADLEDAALLRKLAEGR